MSDTERFLESIDASLKRIADALEAQKPKGVPANVNVQERYDAAIKGLKEQYQKQILMEML